MRPLALLTGLILTVSAYSQTVKNPPLDLSYIRKDSIWIVRDEWGVPHIYAPTDAEVAYGLAWAQCEDDFATMQDFLLIVKGFAGRRQGVEGARLDYATGMLRSADRVRDRYEQDVSPDFKKYLRAFAAGVNRWVELHPEEVRIRKAFPITEYDLVAGFNLGLSLMSGVQDGFTKILENRTEPVSPLILPKGSNAMAVHGSKTEDGKAYIAINSHQPLEGALSWYEAHLVSGEGMNILGGVFPGACTIGHGVNENLAWAHTLSYPDLLDIYKLEMHPRKKNQYRFDGEWKKLESKSIPLKVRFPKSGIRLTVHKKAYWSVYGPTLKTKKGTFAFRMPSFDMLGAAEQWYRMNRARNFTEFREALDRQNIPCFNIVYADRFDTIMYLSNVTVPYRNAQYDWKKTLPGDTSATLWPMKFHAVAELPQVINPQSGYVFNANNSPFLCTSLDDNPDPAKYDPTMGTQLLHMNRSTRFEKRLGEAASDGVVTWNEFLAIKYDRQYPDSFLFPVRVSHVLNAPPAKYPQIADELIRLQRWNRRGDTDNVGGALFAASIHFIMKKTGELEMNSGERPQLPDTLVVSAIREAGDYLKKYFGTLDVPLGQLQRLRRGNVDLPLGGLPDMIVAMYCTPRPDGTFAPMAGESYIMMVKMGKNGPEIETVNAFGASARPGDPHATDQMPLFTGYRRKPMTLDWATVKKNAVKIYSPQ